MRNLKSLCILLVVTAFGRDMLVGPAECSPTIDPKAPVAGRGETLESLEKEFKELKREVCIFLMNNPVRGEGQGLDLNRVIRLFEASLEHVAQAALYIAKMSPYLNEETIKGFDENGIKYTLSLSDARRKLIQDYEKAEADGASDEVKHDILATYFYKACESELSTSAAEKSLYEAVRKAESLLHVKLINSDAEE